MMMESLLTLAASNPVGHIVDRPWFGDGSETSHWLMSNSILMMILTVIATLAIVLPAAKKITTGRHRQSVDDFRAQGAGANFVEAVCLYLREEVFRPILHEQTDKYIGILWTFFWFILIANILGLIPLVDLTGGILGLNHGHGYWGTATQSIWVTGALAFIAFLVINVTGLVKDPKGYVMHLTGGAPWFMWPLMFVVEGAGIFVKPVALALRLFANMSGGHIMLAVLFSFVPSLIKALHGPGYVLALVPLGGAVAIYVLEVLVAVIQAFIFTFLTGLFLGQLVHHDHEHEHAPEDYEEKPGLEHGPIL